MTMGHCCPPPLCRPCHYVAIDVKRSSIVLAVRGSLELGDLETDVTAAALPFEFQVGSKIRVQLLWWVDDVRIQLTPLAGELSSCNTPPLCSPVVLQP